jgi:hypothetical protein
MILNVFFTLKCIMTQSTVGQEGLICQKGWPHNLQGSKL